VAPLASLPRGEWTLDSATASIGLSIAGAAVSLLNTRFFWIGVIAFVLGLIAGTVALRKGVRRNAAAIGVLLNAANLVFDAVLLIVAATH